MTQDDTCTTSTSKLDVVSANFATKHSIFPPNSKVYYDTCCEALVLSS